MPIRLLLASVLLAVSLAAVAARPLRILTEDYPPFNMMGSGGRISGMSTDVLQEAFRRAGVSYAIEMLPWIRALNLTILESNTCLYSTARTDAREHQFKWVGPLVDNPWVLYGRNDSRHAIKSLEEARRFKIGGYSGDATAQFLIDRGFDVDLASTDQLNIKKLLAGLGYREISWCSLAGQRKSHPASSHPDIQHPHAVSGVQSWHAGRTDTAIE